MTKWVRLLVGIALLMIPVYLLDWRETVTILSDVDFGTAALALALLSVNMPLSSTKWELLLRLQGLRVGPLPALRAYWIGSFFNNYLPSSVGGDVVRLFVLKAEGKKAEVASSILVERITGLLVMMAFAAIGVALRPDLFDIRGVLPFLWTLIVGGCVALCSALLWHRQFANLLVKLPFGRSGIASKVAGFLARIAGAMSVYKQQPLSIAVALALSIPFYGILMLFQFLSLSAVGADVTLSVVACITPVILLIAMIPVSTNGLGIAEGAFVLFYTQAGVVSEAALAAALVVRVLSLLVSLVGGLFWINSPRRETAVG